MSARKAASPIATPKPRKLTPQRENFARLLITGYSATEAYRRSFVVHPDTKAATTWNDAYKLQRNPDVLARIEELGAQAASRAVISRESMLVEMGENRTLAVEAGKVSAAVASSRDRAKVLGLHAIGPGGRGDEAARAGQEVSIEARSANDLARKIAFALAKGQREAKRVAK